MKLSALQKFILIESYGQKKVDRKLFNKFYLNKKSAPKGLAAVKIITKSLERLIDRGLIVGFGELTKHKWYISEVRLTTVGQRQTKKLMGEQRTLPFNKKRVISN